ncbi:MAG: glycosyl hydrolase family 18 protein, partial [Thermoanaerobaculia bacterium]
YKVLSTIAYFGLPLAWDGSWNTSGGGWQGFYSQSLIDMINRAHAAGDRVVLSVEDTGEAPLNDILTYPPSTQAALASIIGAISVRGLDGVMIDFEGYTTPSYPNLQSGYTAFLTQLSSQVHTKWPNALVTAATYSGAASWDFGLMKIDAIAPVVDAMFIMAYDMSFSNMSGQAGPDAPLNGWTYNDTLSVNQRVASAGWWNAR